MLYLFPSINDEHKLNLPIITKCNQQENDYENTETKRLNKQNIVLFYTYYESPNSVYNFQYFLEKEVGKHENILYVLIVNGFKISINLQEHLTKNNVIVIKRCNIGYDFGGYFCGLKLVHSIHLLSTFDYFIFLNSSCIGPILPTYLPNTFSWYNAFVTKLNKDVKLVSTTIVCLPKTDRGGYGPKCESFIFVTDLDGLQLFLEEKTIFHYHETKTNAIIHGEYGLSNCIFKHNKTIDCLLHCYQGIDWRNEKYYSLNKQKHPSRKNSLFNISINPLEVIFHKWYWSYDSHNLINFDYIQYYTREYTK